jgi:hypothetical protein
VFEKDVGDFLTVGGMTPEFDGLGDGYVEGYTVAINFTVCLNGKSEYMRHRHWLAKLTDLVI